MIDVSFLLIVFFVLVSRIVDLENPREIRLPALEEALTEPSYEQDRVVINVVPRSDDGAEVLEYRLGVATYPPTADGESALADHIASLLRVNPEVQVNLRASQSTEYKGVEPAMRAVSVAASRSGVAGLRPRVNLVVLREE
jgi:biopolymer transport protein ExbD